MGSSVRSGDAVRSKQRAIAPSSAAHEILCYIIGLSHLGFEELLDTFEQGSGGFLVWQRARQQDPDYVRLGRPTLTRILLCKNS